MLVEVRTMLGRTLIKENKKQTMLQFLTKIKEAPKQILFLYFFLKLGAPLV